MTPDELKLVEQLQLKPIVIKQPTIKDLVNELTPDFLIGSGKSILKMVLTSLVFTICIYLVSLFLVSTTSL